MDLTLTGQLTIRNQIAPGFAKLKTEMDKRLVVWGRLPLAQKKAWALSVDDPIMTLARDSYAYLYKNFFKVIEEPLTIGTP